MPKSVNRNAVVGFTNMLIAALGADRAARGRRRLGHARGADVPAQGVRRLPVGPRVRQVAARAARRCCPSSAARSASRSARRPGYEADDFLAAAVASEEARGGTTIVASGDRDTFQLVERADDDPPADSRRERDRAHRPRRGARALRRRAAAGAGLHRAARRSLGQAAGREGRRPEDGGVAAGAVRLARGDARRRTLLGAGGRASPLQAHRVDGRRSAAARASRRGARLGRRREARRARGG